MGLGKTLKKLSGYDTVKGLWDDFTGKSAIDKQNQYNLQMWELQNQYNLPANQVARLREAGLNPNLFYSQGNVGNATSVPERTAYDRGSGLSKTFGFLSTLYSIKNMKAQNNNLNAQTASINADTALKTTTELLRARELDLKSRELDIIERTGMHPGVGSAVYGIMDTISKSATGKSSLDQAKVVGSALKEALNVQSYVELQKGALRKITNVGRGNRLAHQVADKKGLTGKAREEFLRKFNRIYKNTH